MVRFVSEETKGETEGLVIPGAAGAAVSLSQLNPVTAEIFPAGSVWTKLNPKFPSEFLVKGIE
jgi:hypothetical protein